ncbi:MAG: hypothetical protein ABJC79_00945 [Acidimicrobiia bacterium]
MHRPLKITAIALCVATLGACSSSTSGSTGSSGSSPASKALVARTKAANVPLLDQEAFDTHIHTELIVMVNGAPMTVPTFIGIDQEAIRIATLHTHDATGLIHVESPEKNAKYTLEQFLTVWGMPAGADARCTFFSAQAPCTLAVTSKDSGKSGLEVRLVDQDELTLTVTST